MNSDDSGLVQSFEVTGGEASGDLLSEQRGDRNLKVDLLTCACFEYRRMYEGLRQQVEGDMRRIAEHLGVGTSWSILALWTPSTKQTPREGSSRRRTWTSS